MHPTVDNLISRWDCTSAMTLGMVFCIFACDTTSSLGRSGRCREYDCGEESSATSICRKCYPARIAQVLIVFIAICARRRDNKTRSQSWSIRSFSIALSCATTKQTLVFETSLSSRKRSSMMHTDENSAALAESTHVLRSHSNSQASILHLPDEILLIIFKYVEEDTRLSVFDFDDDDDDDIKLLMDDTDDEDDDCGVPACLAVTHVSRHWRKVALKSPTLWRFIGFTSIFWLDIILERSQKVPLVVQCHP
ncbi:hypothetical protein EDD22DRAFT_1010711 [Suillus occidentalis]|nr:hypothetical protein EDD22DRAFT_1010711 [Suillus occidentalis]